MSKCNAKCEVYSRVCGYFRPVSNWNKGKKEEFKERKLFDVGKVAPLLIAVLLLAGCGGTVGKLTDSASAKNLNMDGYLMLSELETANPETATPQGRLIIGRLTYKSRKVGIPADQKIPTTGYFKATRTRSLFGTEEEIVEYDFTAGSDAEAAKAMAALEAKRAAAERDFAAKSTPQADVQPSEAAASKQAPQASSVNR